MRILDQQLVYSASDLVESTKCSYATVRRARSVLHGEPLPEDADALMERAAGLGDLHEAAVLEALRTAPDGSTVNVIEVGAGSLDDRLRRTEDAVRSGADIIAQAVLFDGRLLGIADFLIRDAEDRYDIADAKLARQAKVSALLQIGAYAELAQTAGLPISGVGVLKLGSGRDATTSLHRITPVVRVQRSRLEGLLRRFSDSQAPGAWDDPAVSRCGQCPVCEQEIEARRDLLLVAGMRISQRRKLLDAGVADLPGLAARQLKVDGIPTETFLKLRAQARLQLAQLEAGAPGPGEGPKVTHEIISAEALAAVPAMNPGDIYFDFEGDPLWQDAATGDWGLEYLFGVLEAPTSSAPARFVPFWAHDRSQEAAALRAFLDYVAQRQEQHPTMRIYHYADYERAALLRVAARHRIGEDEVDGLLRANVLVDLYPIVRKSIRISQPSYSLKKFEPLTMPDRHREGVAAAADSVVEYARFCELRSAGKSAEADAVLADIARYNEFDVESTLALHRWLLAQAQEAQAELPHDTHPPAAATGDEPIQSELKEQVLADPLFAYAEPAEGSPRTPLQRAVALIAAAVGYFRREQKPYWWAHFHRLEQDIRDIEDRNAMVIGDVHAEPWEAPTGRAKTYRRTLVVQGELPPGSEIKTGSDAYLLYDSPVPVGLPTGRPGSRGYAKAEVMSAHVTAEGIDRLDLRERTPAKGDVYAALPTVLTVGPPIRTGSVEEAIHAVARQVEEKLAGSEAHVLPDPVAQLLLREPPRLLGGGALPVADEGDFATAITEAVARLDGSTLAVQGPPGTGKTWVGGHVVARLVNRGWRVGVVSQGHAAVHHFLDGVVSAGAPAAQVGKNTTSRPRPAGSTWTELTSNRVAAFLEDHRKAGRGCVFGGTAWDFTKENRVAPQSLDLLVIDEAGQFSLAHTIAVSVSAQRMLLLGDPQQLPQVSQGTHPEPIESSALGWLLGTGTPEALASIPPEFGYFLDTTWRMHPELTAVVSRHSYDGRLRSNEEVTRARSLTDGLGRTVAPGLIVEQVDHRGNDVVSVEEAARVAELVTEALSWIWHDPGRGPARRISPSDILVVTPYNAQRAAIDQALLSRSITGVRVGTVDKFQGQEAPITIMSMTASAAADVPRGMSFLISPNRINVAVSRAQYRTVVLVSSGLFDYLPGTPEALQDLGAFLDLLGQ